MISFHNHPVAVAVDGGEDFLVSLKSHSRDHLNWRHWAVEL